MNLAWCIQLLVTSKPSVTYKGITDSLCRYRFRVESARFFDEKKQFVFDISTDKAQGNMQKIAKRPTCVN